MTVAQIPEGSDRINGIYRIGEGRDGITVLTEFGGRESDRRGLRRVIRFKIPSSERRLL
jgi:hypothetical protein